MNYIKTKWIKIQNFCCWQDNRIPASNFLFTLWSISKSRNMPIFNSNKRIFETCLFKWNCFENFIQIIWAVIVKVLNQCIDYIFQSWVISLEFQTLYMIYVPSYLAIHRNGCIWFLSSFDVFLFLWVSWDTEQNKHNQNENRVKICFSIEGILAHYYFFNGRKCCCFSGHCFI